MNTMEPEPYRFMWNDHGDNYVEDLIVLRNVFKDLELTRATVRISTKVDLGLIQKFIQRPPLLHMTGSWTMPPWYSGGSASGSRVINPHGVHSGTYSDVGVKCECGQWITKLRSMGIDEHTDECTIEMREGLDERFRSARLNTILEMAHLNCSHEQVEKRLGGKSGKLVTKTCQHYGFEWGDLRQIGRIRMAKTMKMLYEEGETQVDIARAFDTSPSSVRDFIRGRNNTTVEEALAV